MVTYSLITFFFFGQLTHLAGVRGSHTLWELNLRLLGCTIAEADITASQTNALRATTRLFVFFFLVNTHTVS